MDVSGNLLNAMQFYGNGTTLTADFGSNPIISGAITSSGNVGIGTTNPSARLDVRIGSGGSGNLIATFGSSVADRIRLYDEGATYGAKILSNAGNPFLIAAGEPGSNAPLALGANGTEYMRIVYSGNVGIGTTNPGEKLEVAGNITASKITLDSMAFGSIYIRDENPDTVLIVTDSVYYTIKDFSVGDIIKNVTTQDSSITVGVNGVYIVTYSMSMSSTGFVAGNVINAYLYINDVKLYESGLRRFLSGTNDEGDCGRTVRIHLNKNDIVKIKLAGLDNGDDGSIIVWYANLGLNRIE
jgi:hypothetical protein